jgi:hypothetical protein
MRKKQWRDLVGLHRYISNKLTQEDFESKEILKQLDGDISKLTKEDVSALCDKANEKEKVVEDGLVVLKLVEKYTKKYERLRRHIMITNAVVIIEKGKEILQVDEQGKYSYTIQGQIQMENEIEDLLDEQIDFEPFVVDEKNSLLQNKQIKKVISEFI